MGSSASKAASATDRTTNEDERSKDNEILCENCDKKTQKDLPADEPEQCMDQYTRVDQCMKANRGQVTSCVEEWKEFQACHASQKRQL